MAATPETPATEKPAKTPVARKTSSLKKSQRSDYIELRLPKLRLQDTPLSPLWVLLLLIFSFLLGMLTTKVQYLEKEKITNIAAANQGQPPQATAPQISTDDIKSWAKELSLDVNKFTTCFDQNKYTQAIEDDISAATTVDVTATPTFFINGRKVVGAQPYETIKDTIEKELRGESTGDIVDVAPGRLITGNPTAPVTMIEFSDFECPFCRRFHDDTFAKLKSEYIDSGKVKFAYRHLPLSIHPNARPFAQASECANEQGKFWDMHELIFKKQTAA